MLEGWNRMDEARPALTLFLASWVLNCLHGRRHLGFDPFDPRGLNKIYFLERLHPFSYIFIPVMKFCIYVEHSQLILSKNIAQKL